MMFSVDNITLTQQASSKGIKVGFVYHVTLVLDIHGPSVCNSLVSEIELSLFPEFELTKIVYPDHKASFI